METKIFKSYDKIYIGNPTSDKIINISSPYYKTLLKSAVKEEILYFLNNIRIISVYYQSEFDMIVPYVDTVPNYSLKVRTYITLETHYNDELDLEVITSPLLYSNIYFELYNDDIFMPIFLNKKEIYKISARNMQMQFVPYNEVAKNKKYGVINNDLFKIYYSENNSSSFITSSIFLFNKEISFKVNKFFLPLYLDIKKLRI